MLAEPLYCTHCGAEDWACSCPPPWDEDVAVGPFCELCGMPVCMCDNDGDEREWR